MKQKNLFLFSIFLFSIFLLPGIAYALPETIEALGGGIKSMVYSAFLVIGVVGILFAGIMFATANGDTQKLTLAKNAFIWGVVGIIVGIIAGSVMEIIQTEFIK